MKQHTTWALRKTSAIAAAVTVAGTLPASDAAARATTHHQQVKASASLRRVTVSGSAVTVEGIVAVTPNTARDRSRTAVAVTLADATGTTEHRSVKITAKRAFGARWTTKLTGRLSLTVYATIAGKASGKRVTRTITIAPTTIPSTPTGGTPLIGTFKLAPGSTSGSNPSGSYFVMRTPGGGALSNLSSPSSDKGYTPLSPGTDGGLSTVGYQPAPSPAFAGGNSGGALANRIIAPVSFYLVNFSVETSATDAQLGVADPVPSIKDANGVLTGQLTAWDAQWNGQSFNQGTPKPNGTLPAPTTALTGTYDATTKAFTLTWKSLIVGGPFNGFTGEWHLVGTFVPTSTSSTAGGLLPIQLPTLRGQPGSRRRAPPWPWPP